MNFIDTHSHLFLEEFAEDLPLVMQRAKAAGVSRIYMNGKVLHIKELAQIPVRNKSYRLILSQQDIIIKKIVTVSIFPLQCNISPLFFGEGFRKEILYKTIIFLISSMNTLY